MMGSWELEGNRKTKLWGKFSNTNGRYLHGQNGILAQVVSWPYLWEPFVWWRRGGLLWWRFSTWLLFVVSPLQENMSSFSIKK